MVVRRIIWVIGVVVIIFLVAIVSKDKEKYVLRFGLFEDNEFKYYIADGDVYINDKFVGTTARGILDVEDCESGMLEFKPKFRFQLNEKIVYDINCDNKINDFPLNDDEFIVSELNFIDKMINKILTNNMLIKKDALKIINECQAYDRVCQANAVFTEMTEKIKYINDPRNIDNLQSVAQTLDFRAGDCEDFTILLASYLENIGIRTMLVSANNHVYTLACGLKQEDVKNLVEKGKTFWWYELKNDKCFVLDPTVPGTYLGYSPNLNGEKIAVDPITKEYFILKE